MPLILPLSLVPCPMSLLCLRYPISRWWDRPPSPLCFIRNRLSNEEVMAENETQETSESDTAVAEIPYNIRVEDAGPATKKVYVEIPKERVAEKIAEQFKELRQGAHIPGFRKGRAPQKLIEKKFSSD